MGRNPNSSLGDESDIGENEMRESEQRRTTNRRYSVRVTNNLAEGDELESGDFEADLSDSRVTFIACRLPAFTINAGFSDKKLRLELAELTSTAL
jgi:hypothetical protein